MEEKIVERLIASNGKERTYHLQDLINVSGIVIPPKDILTQKRIVEPSTPNTSLRVPSETLTTAGSGTR